MKSKECEQDSLFSVLRMCVAWDSSTEKFVEHVEACLHGLASSWFGSAFFGDEAREAGVMICWIVVYLSRDVSDAEWRRVLSPDGEEGFCAQRFFYTEEDVSVYERFFESDVAATGGCLFGEAPRLGVCIRPGLYHLGPGGQYSEWVTGLYRWSVNAR
jgi:hypothetical protein